MRRFWRLDPPARTADNPKRLRVRRRSRPRDHGWYEGRAEGRAV